MGKQKTKLDRKTRRAIAHAIRNQVTSGSTGGNSYTKRASNTATFNVSSGNITGWSTSASANSIKGGSAKPMKLTYLPPITGSLFVSHHTSDDLHWHLKVAEKLLPDIDWTFVCRTTGENEVSMDQMAFYSQADKETFETWMTSYLEKFGGHADLMLPAPLGGDFPYTVRSNFNRTRAATNNLSLSNSVSSDDSYEQQLEQWLWILDNCEGEVRHAGTFWFFADKGDAALFKIAYS
jgi:hypothetical protein